MSQEIRLANEQESEVRYSDTTSEDEPILIQAQQKRKRESYLN